MKKCVFAMLLLSLPAWAYTDEGRLPYTGQAGQLPLQVVTDFLGHRLGQEGRFEYATLKIEQHSRPEAFDHARISVVREGLLDDSVRANRWRFDVNRASDGRWRIDSVREDFACYRGREGWGVRPCQ